jgi:hypothetical protein
MAARVRDLTLPYSVLAISTSPAVPEETSPRLPSKKLALVAV